jgi:hypothetical protein
MYDEANAIEALPLFLTPLALAGHEKDLHPPPSSSHHQQYFYKVRRIITVAHHAVSP